jgi:hypothetical protein
MKPRKLYPARPKPFISTAWWLSVNGVVAAISALIAIAALVVTIIAIPKPPEKRPPSDLRQTPALGLSFWQDDTAAHMKDISIDVAGLVPRVLVTLKPGPFEMRFPDLTEQDTLCVLAGKDDSVFAIKEDSNVAGPPYDSPFQRGRGHFDEVRSSGTRMEQAGNGKSSVYYSRFDDPKVTRHKTFPTGVYEPSSASLTQLQEFQGDLFLAVWKDGDLDDVIDGGEYEYVTLRFSVA